MNESQPTKLQTSSQFVFELVSRVPTPPPPPTPSPALSLSLSFPSLTKPLGERRTFSWHTNFNWHHHHHCHNYTMMIGWTYASMTLCPLCAHCYLRHKSLMNIEQELKEKSSSCNSLILTFPHLISSYQWRFSFLYQQSCSKTENAWPVSTDLRHFGFSTQRRKLLQCLPLQNKKSVHTASVIEMIPVCHQNWPPTLRQNERVVMVTS